MIFIVVTSGACWLQLEGAEPRLFQQGSLALIPHSTPHVLSSAPDMEGDHCSNCLWRRSASVTRSCVMAAAAQLTRTMYGVVRFDDVAAEHLLKLLPQIIMIDSWDDQTGGWLQSTLRFIANEATIAQTGRRNGHHPAVRCGGDPGDPVLARNRAHGRHRLAGKALRDPQIGKALALMHRRARRGLERRHAGRRSRDVALSLCGTLCQSGRPDAASLPDRMADAPGPRPADRHGRRLAAISMDLGYQSEAAFCRAFKRVFGKPPGSIRRAEPGRAGPVYSAAQAAG
jgi:AraC-like DNA-binding protein